MIISKELKYIYLAVPKTGTTSIQNFLLSNDSSANKNFIKIKNKSFKFGEHMTALEVKEILGDHYTNFKVIGFIRHPYGRIVSSYFFYKKGAKSWAWEGRENKKPTEQKFKILYAKITPFWFWALTYPYKSNIEYFYDENNNLIVDIENIGLFENLEEHFKNIYRKNNIAFKDNLPHKNKSKHKPEDQYFKNLFFRKIISFKIKADLAFYNKVALKRQNEFKS